MASNFFKIYSLAAAGLFLLFGLRYLVMGAYYTEGMTVMFHVIPALMVVFALLPIVQFYDDPEDLKEVADMLGDNE